MSRKITKSKIGNKDFNLTKKWFNSTEISNQSSMFIFVHVNFSCFDNITAKNSKTKCYKQLYLSRCSGGGGLSFDVVRIFLQGGRKSDIMDF